MITQPLNAHVVLQPLGLYVTQRHATCQFTLNTYDLVRRTQAVAYCLFKSIPEKIIALIATNSLKTGCGDTIKPASYVEYVKRMQPCTTVDREIFT